MKKILLACAVLVVAASGFSADLPPGRWWKRPQIVNYLALSEEQQVRLEATFRRAAPLLIDAKATVDKESVALRSELDQVSPNRENVQKVAARLGAARSQLFEREVLLFVDMRAVLSDVQWNKLRTALDRMDPAFAPQRDGAGMRKQP